MINSLIQQPDQYRSDHRPVRHSHLHHNQFDRQPDQFKHHNKQKHLNIMMNQCNSHKDRRSNSRPFHFPVHPFVPFHRHHLRQNIMTSLNR